MTTENEFDSLIEKLIAADDAYYNSGVELLSDVDYDRLKRNLFQQDPSHEYFAKVGSDIRGGKIALPYKMGSLDHYGTDTIKGWVSTYGLADQDVIESYKKDGISGMLEYRSGALSIAYSRGNGLEGADITRHVKHVPNVPRTLEGEDYFVVRGEFIMKNETFNKKWSKDFANPRVTVAGSMNRSESRTDIISDIDFIAYEVVASNSVEFKTKVEQLEYLKALGFQIVNYTTRKGKELNGEFLTDSLLKARAKSEYELDGLVITIDRIKEVEKKRNSSTLNPEESIKFKINMASDEVETNVTNVLWEVSKNGYWKPRVEVLPVNLFGTTVTYVTGHNAKNIVDNRIGIGSRIKITKSGTVIPYITEVLSPAPKLTLPETTLGEWKWNDTDVDIVLVDPDSCKLVRLKQVLDFVETLNVELLKESSLSKVFDSFNLWDKSFNDAILTLVDLHRPEWESAVGSNGSKIHASLHRRLSNMELHTFIGASKYMPVGFGVRKAKTLIAAAGSTPVWELTEADVAEADGFSSLTAPDIVTALAQTKNLFDAVMSTGYMKMLVVTKTAELSELNVVMTGFRDPDLAAEIEKRGGKNGSGVSKKTTHLLTTDPNSGSGKAKKARELGVEIMTPDEFKDLFNI